MKVFVELVREMMGESPNLEEILSQEIFQFLKEKQKLDLIRQDVIYRPRIGKRFGTATISKLLTPDFNISVFLTKIFDELDFKALVSIDMDFLIETKDPDAPLKFQYGSRATGINRTKKLILPEDVHALVKEFEGKTKSDLLNDVFTTHQSILHYQESGFRPHSLICLKIFLTSLS